MLGDPPRFKPYHEGAPRTKIKGKIFYYRGHRGKAKAPTTKDTNDKSEDTKETKRGDR